MTKHFLNISAPDLGYYEVFGGALGFRWTWREVANGVEHVDHGKWRETKAEAYRDAADDWQSNGNGSNRLSGQLRAAATRAARPSPEGDNT